MVKSGLILFVFVSGLLAGWVLHAQWNIRALQTGGEKNNNVSITSKSMNRPAPGQFIEADSEKQLQSLLAGRQFEALLDLLKSLELEMDIESHQALRLSLQQSLRMLLSQDLSAQHLIQLTQLAENYLNNYVHDNSMHRLAADLHLKSGHTDSAIRSLYKILEFPDHQKQVKQTTARIRALVVGQAQALEREKADLELVVLYNWLLGLEPGNDDYRVALARWSLKIGDLASASRNLGDVSDPDLAVKVEVLLESIALRQSDIPTFRKNGHLMTKAYFYSGPGLTERSKAIQLLLDTGASITSVDLALLVSLGAQDTGRTALVGTAAGQIDAPVYTIELLQVGNVKLKNHRVLGMRIPVPGIDGLLGMDILGRTDLNLVPRPY